MTTKTTKYNNLNVSAHKNPKRVGRGISGGQGKTAGRGTKGQTSRAGGGVRLGFEGGQNPLLQSLPKLRGFTSHRKTPEVVYTGDLSRVKGATIDNFTLFSAGLVTSPYTQVKLVIKGDVSEKYKVNLQKASTEAIKLIEKAGGSFKQVKQVKREKTAKRKRS